MPHTFDSALEDELVTVLKRDDSTGYYEIRIGVLETVVTIELGRFMDSENTKFTVSHSIKTPGQAAPYRSGRFFYDYPAYALRMAIRGLTEHYCSAVRTGHKPDESWLMEN